MWMFKTVWSEFDLCCCLEVGSDMEQLSQLSASVCMPICHHSSFLENEPY
jgi:hypothetical protein